MEEQTVVVARAEVITGNGVQGDSPLCTLIIPNSLLLDIHENGKGYIAGVNEKIQGKMVTLNSSCDGLETALTNCWNALQQSLAEQGLQGESQSQRKLHQFPGVGWRNPFC